MTGSVGVDLAAAADFLAGSARVLDRAAVRRPVLGRRSGRGPGRGRRLPESRRGLRLGPGAGSAIADQPARWPHCTRSRRSPTSLRPRAAGRATSATGSPAVTLPDGGLPFALPLPDPAACAPFWAGADGTSSSLQITAVIVADGHPGRRARPLRCRHPWLAGRPTSASTRSPAWANSPHAMELEFAVQFLDAVAPSRSSGRELLDGLGRHLSAATGCCTSPAVLRRVHAPPRFRPFPRAARRGTSSTGGGGRRARPAGRRPSSRTGTGWSTSTATPPPPPWSGAVTGRCRRSPCSAPTGCSRSGAHGRGLLRGMVCSANLSA